MILKSNPYFKLFMNSILLHCLMCFLHASFEKDSAPVYVCMFYIGIMIVGQYSVRQKVRSFVPYLLLHILLIAPCVIFLIFSVTDAVLMGILAITTTVKSFHTSVTNKNKLTHSSDVHSPFEILLLPLFAIIGSYYGYHVYSVFVFFEALIYLILFVYYTFNINEQLFTRDHCTTVNIPFKRIHSTMENIKYTFIATIVVIMLLVSGINIVIPQFSLNYDPSTVEQPIYKDTKLEYDGDYIGFLELGERANPPSALAVFLSYVFAGLIVLAFVVLLFILIISAFRTLHNNIYAEKHSSTYFEDDEITIEALAIKRSAKKRSAKRTLTNNEKIRTLFKNATIKKLHPTNGTTLNLMLNSKTPSEINNALKSEDTYSDEVLVLYHEARYSNHEISNDSVKAMKHNITNKSPNS